MNKIIFLLGAGASCNALPMVSQIEKELAKIISSLREPAGPNDSKLRSQYSKRVKNSKIENRHNAKLKSVVLDEFVTSLEWLEKSCSEHFSIDTYAKKLYLQQKFSKLNELKITLSCFFTLLQNTGFDNRYDSFLASIIDDLKLLPSNIQVVSWNYDYQLEIGMSNFLNTKDLKYVNEFLKVYSKGDKLESVNRTNQFSLFKVNGTTQIKSEEKRINITDTYGIDELDLLDEVLFYYYSVKDKKTEPSLSFAWENEVDGNFFELIGVNIFDRETLVIIGYSFPFFNRKVDSKILKTMRNLKKIYIQDPHNADAIEQRVKSLFGETAIGKNITYQKIKDIKDQFYLPFEL